MWRFYLIPDDKLKEVHDAIIKKEWRAVAVLFNKYRVTSGCSTCSGIADLVLWCDLAIERNYITSNPKNRVVDYG